MSKQTGYIIGVLPGDGIGQEVIAEAEKVLRAVGDQYGHSFVLRHGLVGGPIRGGRGSQV
jgi:3-isopropylmalate dehydrogenase